MGGSIQGKRILTDWCLFLLQERRSATSLWNLNLQPAPHLRGQERRFEFRCNCPGDLSSQLHDRQDRPPEDNLQTPQTAIEARLTKAWLTWVRRRVQGSQRDQQVHCEVLLVRHPDPIADRYCRESAVGLSPQSDDPSSCQRSQCPRCVH